MWRQDCDLQRLGFGIRQATLLMYATVQEMMHLDNTEEPNSAVRSVYIEDQLIVCEKLEKAVVTHGTDIVRFTQRNLVRVYPKASRIDSSNFNPLIGWMHGSQMVAFNMQGHRRSLWLMQGMFRANGGCGYVKKPDFLLKSDGEVFDPKRQLPVKTTLKVKVYMGEGWNLDFHRTHFDLYSPPDFYVKVLSTLAKSLYDARANTGVDRAKIIDSVAKCVPRPHKVDLGNPDINIVVQIVKG